MSRTRLSLLVVSTTLNTGGAQRFTSTLLQHLDRNQFSVELALLRDDIGYSLPEDVPVHLLGYRGLWELFRAAGKLRTVIEQTRPDVVLSNITATNLFVGLALNSTQYRPRWMARIGNNPRSHDSWLRKLFARQIYPQVDGFVTNSTSLANEFANYYNVPPRQVEVIANPTDFRAIDQLAATFPEKTWAGNKPLLIAVGRLFPQKRYDILLDAFARIHQQIPAHLWICGEGPCRRSLERLIRKLRLTNHVELLGFCHNPYTLMKQATMFVMSSDHEGLPNALIEAQGLGLPAVSTDCPYGPSEIIDDGQTGYLTPVGSAPKFAEAVLSVLNDAECERRMTTAAKQRTRERFDVEKLTQCWQNSLEAIVQKQRGEARCVG
ncbi:MAG: glycosyltransferase [Planctomycetaceae bacterium]|nr:glycosyltransferase [Planctomycetaceae bacterium]